MPTNYIAALDELAEEIAETSERKGFWDMEADELAQVVVKLALVHDEVSEALTVHRDVYDDDQVDEVTGMTSMQEADFTEELADVVIRVLDIAGFLDLEIGTAIVSKIEKNKSRPHRHGKRY